MAAFSLCLFLLLSSYSVLTSNFIMLFQPARQIPPFPPFSFLGFFFCYSGLDSLSFTEARFPEISLLSQELHYLLFIPACLSAAINPLPVTDQDPSAYHLIIVFGSFPNLSFSPLKSVICSLYFTGSVIFQHFIFTICPEPQVLWYF